MSSISLISLLSNKTKPSNSVLITGAKGSGKTSFVKFLETALALPAHKQTRGHTPPPHMHNDSPFGSSYVETDIEGERVGVTLWDSQGLEKSIIDLQLRDLTAFVESKFEETFNQESRVVRTPGVKDTHIHCVLLLLDPARLDVTMRSKENFSTKKSLLDEDEALDLDVIRALEGKTTVIPIIAKADTLTAAHMAHLKRLVWSNVKHAKLDPLEALNLDDDDEDESPDSEAQDSEFSSSESEIPQATRSPPRKVTEDTNAEDSDTMGSTFSPVRKTSRAMLGPISSKRTDSCTPGPEELFLPFSILSPDSHTSPGALTRVFPWGEADPCNPVHCDYVRLRECVFGDWRSDLRVTSREKWYENWRTSRLKRIPTSRVRVSGGVTPITAVPKEGRTVSPTITTRSRAVSTSKQSSRLYDEVPERPRTMSTSKAERVLGSPRGIAL
jgi:septin family protein